MDAREFVPRSELERTFDRMEGRLTDKQDEILEAVRELRVSMNGQFRAQGELLRQHDVSISVLQDRGTRDVGARWWAGAGTALAAFASYWTLKP